MGIFGFGRDEPRTAASSALDRAATSQPSGGLSGVATGLVERLLDVGIDGRGRFRSAQAVADAALARSADAEAAVDRVVRSHVALAGANGFVTGLGGFVTLPVALPVNVVGFYVLATRMTAAVAALRGYNVQQEAIRTAVMLSLVGADADDLLRKVGISATSGGLANLAVQRLPGPTLMVVNKAIGFRLVAQAGRSTLGRLGRGVPVVGGAVSAGLDAYVVKRVADSARREFPRRGAAQT